MSQQALPLTFPPPQKKNIVVGGFIYFAWVASVPKKIWRKWGFSRRYNELKPKKVFLFIENSFFGRFNVNVCTKSTTSLGKR